MIMNVTMDMKNSSQLRRGQKIQRLSTTAQTLLFYQDDTWEQDPRIIIGEIQ